MNQTHPTIADVRKHLKGKAVRTRFAPSPTGFLHLGHVASAIYVWGLAQGLDGEVLLRIEDHDQSRNRPEFQQAIIDNLH